MKLRFLPAEGCMPLQPFATMMVGGPKRYLGRKFDPETGEYPVADPYECEDGTNEAARCRKFVMRGEAVPADAETAKALGVAFEGSSKKSRSSKAGSEASS